MSDADTEDAIVEEKTKRNDFTLEWCNVDLHDTAGNIWHALHPNDEDADFYDCKLCGSTIYPSMDYEHEPDCPYEKLGHAIDEFTEAVRKARTAPETPGAITEPKSS